MSAEDKPGKVGKTIHTTVKKDEPNLEKKGMTRDQAATAESVAPGLDAVMEAILRGDGTVFSGTVSDSGDVDITVVE